MIADEPYESWIDHAATKMKAGQRVDAGIISWLTRTGGFDRHPSVICPSFTSETKNLNCGYATYWCGLYWKGDLFCLLHQSLTCDCHECIGCGKKLYPAPLDENGQIDRIKLLRAANAAP